MIDTTRRFSAAMTGVTLFGLLLSTVGVDITLGFPRFTFGNIDLLNGVNFIPAITGAATLPDRFPSRLAPPAAH